MTHKRRFKVFLITAGFLFSTSALSKNSNLDKKNNFSISSGNKRINSVELFTSEGCSSCPPADQLMASLRDHPNLWKTFVPIEFHVDYWNKLGWSDPFSKKSFTNRQSHIAKILDTSGIYTPAFFTNGNPKWPDVDSIKVKGKEIGNLIVTKSSNDIYSVSFITVSSKSNPEKLYLNHALLGNGLISKIPSGENAGKTLRHEFVVLNLNKSLLKKGGNKYTGEFKVTPTTGKIAPKSNSIAVWISRDDQVAPLQSLGWDLK